jgi:hypothetical protein
MSDNTLLIVALAAGAYMMLNKNKKQVVYNNGQAQILPRKQYGTGSMPSSVGIGASNVLASGLLGFINGIGKNPVNKITDITDVPISHTDIGMPEDPNLDWVTPVVQDNGNDEWMSY